MANEKVSKTLAGRRSGFMLKTMREPLGGSKLGPDNAQSKCLTEELQQSTGVVLGLPPAAPMSASSRF